jgi:putative long chain acyl-CoA synthase
VLGGLIRDALGDLPAVDLTVAYGVVPDGAEHEVPVAAVTVRAGRKLTARDVTAALRSIPPGQRPQIVRVVDRIPVTTWFRPLTAPLRAAGIPAPADRTQAWYRDSDVYRPLARQAPSSAPPS